MSESNESLNPLDFGLYLRITTVLTEHTWMTNHGICACGSADKNHPAHVADAVIRELKLREETLVDYDEKPAVHRYVTEWETTDD